MDAKDFTGFHELVEQFSGEMSLAEICRLEGVDYGRYLYVLRISEKYYSPKAPEYYHPMWYEIRPAVMAWLEVRDKIADSLSSDRAKSYHEQT